MNNYDVCVRLFEITSFKYHLSYVGFPYKCLLNLLSSFYWIISDITSDGIVQIVKRAMHKCRNIDRILNYEMFCYCYSNIFKYLGLLALQRKCWVIKKDWYILELLRIDKCAYQTSYKHSKSFEGLFPSCNGCFCMSYRYVRMYFLRILFCADV